MFDPEILKSKQFICVLAVSVCSAIMGFSSSYTGTALVSMEMDLVLDDAEKSWIVSMISMGGCLGSIFGGPLIDYFGRKVTIMGTGIPFIASYFFIAFADRVSMIIIGRLLGGICVGINSMAIPVFLGETLDAKIRGTLGIFPTAFGNAGILVAFIAGKYLNWRELAYLGAILPAGFMIMMAAISESPRYYASINQRGNAEKALEWYRGPDVNVGDELNEILSSSSPDQLNPPLGLFQEFRKPATFKPVCIILMLMSVQQFSGVNAIIGFIVTIFEFAAVPLDSHACAIFFGVINFIAVFLAIPIIDKHGRKVLLYISNLVMIFTLILFGIYFYMDYFKFVHLQYFHWLPVFSAVFYILGFSFGFGPVPWLMMGEILPLSIRGFAAGMLSAYNWACAFIVQRSFLFLVATLDEWGTFWLYAMVCIIGFYMIQMVPETKGKSLEMIETELLNDTDGPGFMETFNM